MVMLEVHGHLQRHLVRMRCFDVVVDLVRPILPGIGHLLVRNLIRVWWGMR